MRADLERHLVRGHASGPRNRGVDGRDLAEKHRFRKRRLLVRLAVLFAENRRSSGGILLLGRKCRERSSGSPANDQDVLDRVTPLRSPGVHLGR